MSHSAPSTGALPRAATQPWPLAGVPTEINSKAGTKHGVSRDRNNLIAPSKGFNSIVGIQCRAQ
jgi:hypothetical protein